MTIFGKNPYENNKQEVGKALVITDRLQELKTSSTFRLLFYIIQNEKEGVIDLNENILVEFMEDSDIKSLATVTKSIQELLNARFIAYTNVKYVYWVNKIYGNVN